MTIKDMILPVIGGCVQAFGYISWKQACKYEPSVVKVNIILNLQIVITFVIDLLFISRVFEWTRVIGALFVFIGGCVIITSKVKRKGGKAEQASKKKEIHEETVVKPETAKIAMIEDPEISEKSSVVSPVVSPAQPEMESLKAKQLEPSIQLDISVDSNSGVEEFAPQDDSEKFTKPEVATVFSSTQNLVSTKSIKHAQEPTRVDLDDIKIQSSSSDGKNQLTKKLSF